MTTNITIESYKLHHKKTCLALFDLNCPQYFAINEYDDYASFLDEISEGYFVCFQDENLVGAFGLCQSNNSQWNINWILINPTFQGAGIGRVMMHKVMQLAVECKIENINIAASHLSAPFFTKYEAVKMEEITDGWGVGMHRINMKLAVNLQ